MANKEKRQQSSRAQQSLFKRRRWLILGSAIIVAMVGIGVVHMMNKDKHQAPKYRTMIFTISINRSYILLLRIKSSISKTAIPKNYGKKHSYVHSD